MSVAPTPSLLVGGHRLSAYAGRFEAKALSSAAPRSKEHAVATVKANGIELCYQTHGVTGPWILLVMGLGQQLVSWPPEFVELLVQAGFRVLVFDNRDVGFSTKMEGEKVMGLPQAMLRSRFGFKVPAPYNLTDMMTDTSELLEALELDRVHAVGVSMGGMISQLLAIHHPSKVASLTSIMSTTGERSLPSASARSLAALARRRRPQADREDLIRGSVATKRVLAGSGYPTSEEEMWAKSARNIDRMWYPAGYLRQTIAVLASGDRKAALEGLNVPTLVLHGEEDPLVPVAHGRRTAALVPGAKLQTFPGWGHDLAPGILPELARAITAHVRGIETSHAA